MACKLPGFLICSAASLGVLLASAGAWATELPPQFWEQHNRSLGLRATTLSQFYREADPSGQVADGVLDTERGDISGMALQAEWQGHWTRGVTIPLWVQAAYSRTPGQTDYQGHLQELGVGIIAPYSTVTHNALRTLSLRLGVPLGLGADAGGASAVQLTPYWEWLDRRWQREVVSNPSYGETYALQAASLGLRAQWRVAPQWVLESWGSTGWQYHTNLRVPELGFSAALGHNSINQYGVGAQYDFSPRYSLDLGWQQTRYRSSESAVVNGLLEPASRTRQSVWSVGLRWHY
jgi:hypothetical protein